MSKTSLLLGGNIGDRMQLLGNAAKMINEKIGTIVKSSSVYETEPWGFQSEKPFLNQVIIVETGLSPKGMLKELLNIEKNLGRKRISTRYESRSIDIDILMYDNLIIDEEDLQIPHPRLHKRRFALIPLAEIAGDIIHPVLKVRLEVLAHKCKDNLKVELYENVGIY